MQPIRTLRPPFPRAGLRILGLPAVLAAFGAPSALHAQQPAGEFAPDRVVLVLRADAPEFPRRLESAVGALQVGDPALDPLLQRFGGRALEPAIRSPLPHRDPALFRSLGLHRHYLVEIAPESDEREAAEAFAACPLVESARLDGLARAIGTAPDDPMYSSQWPHHQASGVDIDTDLAWDVAKDAAGITVAIVDTGVDLDHPDLVAGLVAGYDFINGDAVPEDDYGHGTAVAGVVGARGNNGIGVAGVAWACSMVPVKVLGSSGSGPWSVIASGITFSVDAGSDVINLSLGGYTSDAGVSAALAYAAGLDVLSVAASGNDDLPTVLFPASDPLCMGVGATSPCDERKTPSSCDGEFWWGSNYGPAVDLVAPGVQIATTKMGDAYKTIFNGTSSATPHVAGVAALVRSLAPALTYKQVKSLLQDTADDEVGPASEDKPGYDVYFGYGRLNANRAVLAAHPAGTRRVSISSAGFQAAGSSEFAYTSLSVDGRFVAFSSAASDLASPDINPSQDIFVHDRVDQTTSLVSLGPGGVQANSYCALPSVSSDGRHVAFASTASNLAAGAGPGYHVYVRDGIAAVTTLLSVSLAGSPGNGESHAPSISAGGRYVTFYSYATDLVGGDGNGTADVFVRDRDTDDDGVFDEPGAVLTELVSLSLSGTVINAAGNGMSLTPVVSADGLHVAFYSQASDLVNGDTNGQADIFVRDLATGTTRLVSISSAGALANSYSGSPDVSGDGRFVVFQSTASNLGPDANGWYDVFVHDRDADSDGVFDESGAISTALVSQSSSGAFGGAGSYMPAISDDGRWISFASDASVLVPGDTNGVRDVFLRDRAAGITTRVNQSSSGTQADDKSATVRPSISGDGRVVAFESDATNLVPTDTNAVTDVFARVRFEDDLYVQSLCSCGPGGGSAPCGNAGASGAGCANSTGAGALLSAAGTTSVAADDLVLTASGLPTFKTCLYFMGGGLTSGGPFGLSFGDGKLCVASGGVGTFRFPAGSSGSAGSLTLGPGIAALSCSLFPGAGCIDAGSTWTLQCWYRDPAGPCGGMTNLTNALAVTFAP